MADAGASAVAAPSRGRESVKVVVRCRPLFGKELVEGRQSVVVADETQGTITLNREEGLPKTFTFDAVYGTESLQKTLYEETAYPLVEAVMEGFNGTIFAYGQTGCGKTFTMQGSDEREELRGVIPNSFDHVFENIRAGEGQEFLVRASYLEIYNEEIRDLLSNDPKKKLELKESADKGVYVKNLTDVVVEDVQAINDVMERGFRHRTVGATLMNNESSRSHSIFSIVVEVSERGEDGADHVRVGKLNLVDLAGSERQSKTQASGERLKEGCKINLSLSALGNVISALVDGKGKHIPYRDSKLTRLLQDSLGGNTKTVMVACISPADYNYDESMSTLRYANRAKNIKNKPVINEDPKDAMLRQYKEEIERLMSALQNQAMAGSTTGMTVSAAMTEGSALAPIAGAGAAAPAGATPPQIVEKVVVERVEVESEATAAQRRALEEYNASISDQRDRLGNELESERAAREQLTAKLAELQTKIMGGAGGSADPTDTEAIEQAVAKQQREARRAQQKLKARKKKEAMREQQHQAELEQQQQREEELKSAVESAAATSEQQAREYQAQREQQGRKIQRLKGQLAESQQEIADLTDEFEQEREHLLHMLREQNREVKLLTQVAEVILPTKEMGKIWERSNWDEEREEWTLPKIKPRSGFKLTDMKLPSLGGGGGPPPEGTPTVDSDEEVPSGRNSRSSDGRRDRGKPPSSSSSRSARRREKKEKERERSRGGEVGALDGGGWPTSMGSGVADEAEAAPDRRFGDRVGSRQGGRRGSRGGSGDGAGSPADFPRGPDESDGRRERLKSRNGGRGRRGGGDEEAPRERAPSRNGSRARGHRGGGGGEGGDERPIERTPAPGGEPGERAPSRNGSRAQHMRMQVTADDARPTVSLSLDGVHGSARKREGAEGGDGLNFSFNATLTFGENGTNGPPSGGMEVEPPPSRSGRRKKKHEGESSAERSERRKEKRREKEAGGGTDMPSISPKAVDGEVPH